MPLDWVAVIGFVAGLCTTLSFLPQAVKIWRSRSARDVSLGMFSVMVTGVALWLLYGILREDLPIIAANTPALGLTGAILYLKLRHG
jgi:MtN3 and saliva related transmembrane protein